MLNDFPPWFQYLVLGVILAAFGIYAWFVGGAILRLSP